MSVKKYLTLNGLAYFLNKIKSTMADELDGKANDSEVLHKAQTETVTGEKTFKKDVKIIDLNANERPGVKFEVNGSFRTFEQAKDSLPDPDFGDFGGGTLWDGGFLADNTKIQNSMSDYVINDITFGTANYSSVIEFNNYYKVTYEDGHNSPEDVTGMLRFELAPYENVEKDHEYWSDPDLYLYAMLDGGFSGGSTILGNPRAPWSKAYIGEINCEDIKFGFGMLSIFDVLGNIRNLSYVTHYSSTALTPSSTNSNSLLDNTDNLKVGDKVIDSNGVLFSVTAIDTANSTFTIGTALIDLAQDSDVVHKSGDETVGGQKTFANNLIIVGRNTDSSSAIQLVNSDVVGDSANGTSGFEVYGTSVSDANKIGGVTVGEYSNNSGSYALIECNRTVSGVKSSNVIRNLIRSDGTKELSATIDNDCKLGSAFLRWSKIYGTEYYYGSNNVEFSTKFVTTDTAQTISGNKTFSSNVNIYNSDPTATTPSLYLKSSKIEISSQGNTSGDQNLTYLDKNNRDYAYIKGAIQSNGSAVKIRAVAKDSSDNSVINELQMLAYTNGNKSIFPSYSNEIDLGISNYKWKSVYATNYYYGANNIEFSTKFVTTDTAQTITGTKTFTDSIVAKKIVSNVSQLQINAKTNADSIAMVGGNSAIDGGGVWVYGKNTSNKSMVTLQVYDTDNSVYHAVRLNMDGSLTPTVSNNGLGSSSYKWVSFNGLNPSALSMPDLSNGIDISSYITHLDKVVNSYTPAVNGWISIRVKKTSLAHTSLMIYQTNGLLSSCEADEYNISGTNLPVIANQNVEIYIYADALVEAKFYPCQGNV